MTAKQATGKKIGPTIYKLPENGKYGAFDVLYRMSTGNGICAEGGPLAEYARQLIAEDDRASAVDAIQVRRRLKKRGFVRTKSAGVHAIAPGEVVIVKGSSIDRVLSALPRCKEYIYTHAGLTEITSLYALVRVEYRVVWRANDGRTGHPDWDKLAYERALNGLLEGRPCDLTFQKKLKALGLRPDGGRFRLPPENPKLQGLHRTFNQSLLP